MGITRRSFMKYLVWVLSAWGIAPAALAKSADNGPGLASLPTFDGWHEETIDIYNPSAAVTGRIYGYTGRKVNFNSKDYGVVIINSNPNIRWKLITDRSAEHHGGVMKWR